MEVPLIKALVVYDSVYGNSEKIVRAIAGALTSSSEVKVLHAGEVNNSEFESVDLLVVGSPTQGGKPTPAIQKFLSKIPANALKDVSVISFDIKVKNFIATLFGFAAVRIVHSLEDKGGHVAVLREGFIVKGKEGPLKEGELERAAGWAKGILLCVYSSPVTL